MYVQYARFEKLKPIYIINEQLKLIFLTCINFIYFVQF